MHGHRQKQFEFDGHVLDARKRSLTRAGVPIALNAKAFDLLLFFLENAARVIGKDEILDIVWKDQFVEESNLTVQISAIRKALGDQASDPRFLATVPGRGYQFIANVVVLEGLAAVSVAYDRNEQQVSRDEHGKEHQNYGAGRLRVLRWTFMVPIVGILVAAAVYFGGGSKPSGVSTESVAVLPFSNETGDPESDFMGEGLAESVIYSLSRVPGLRVLSRDSSFRYRGTPDIAEIGRHLNAGVVIIGRVTEAKGIITVSVEAISTNDLTLLWGEQFSRAADDIELFQSDLPRSIANGLRLSLSRAQRSEADQTADHNAFQQYLIGRHELAKLTDEGFRNALERFESATRLDPGYALAWTGIAEAQNLLSGWGAVSPYDGFPLAKAAALRALELDPNLSEAYTQIGIVRLFFELDPEGAEQAFSKAIELNPNDAEAHHMTSYVLMARERFEEARLYALRARDLDPLSVLKSVTLGNVHYFEKNAAAATVQYQRALELEPYSGLALWSLGNAQLLDKKYSEAIASYLAAIKLSGDSPEEPAMLAYAYAKSGNQAEARRLASELKKRSERDYVPASLFALVHSALGETDEAFEYLELALRERDSALVFIRVEPAFQPLRSDPRFAEFLNRMGLD